MEEKLDRILELLENSDIVFWIKIVIWVVLGYLAIGILWALFVSKGGWKK